MRVNTCWFSNRRSFKSTVESFIYCKVHGNRGSDYQGVPALLIVQLLKLSPFFKILELGDLYIKANVDHSLGSKVEGSKRKKT